MTKIQIRKQQILVIGIFLFLLLAGILGSYFVLHRSIPHRVVVISQDGKEVQRIAMDTVKNPHIIEITGEDGAWNRVWISEDCVKMESASCPDGLCCPLSACQIKCRFKLLRIIMRNHQKRRSLMQKSVKHLVTLAMFTTMALVIFVVEAQIPVPVPIPGIKLGLANIITLFVLQKYRVRDALAVLVLRIFLGSLFTGTLVSCLYSLSGGLLCLVGMALLCRLLQNRYLWFVSVCGAILHNIGQILAAMLVMQTTLVNWYLPFLLISGCVTGLFTGLAATFLIRHCMRTESAKQKKDETKTISAEHLA